MPTAPLPFCAEPGCKVQVVRGRCAVHRRQVRDRPGSSWYNLAAWKHPIYGLRARVLREQPFCDGWPPGSCTRALTTDDAQVDHVVPHAGDPRLFWNRANLHGLCTACHAAKTRYGL